MTVGTLCGIVTTSRHPRPSTAEVRAKASGRSEALEETTAGQQPKIACQCWVWAKYSTLPSTEYETSTYTASLAHVSIIIGGTLMPTHIPASGLRTRLMPCTNHCLECYGVRSRAWYQRLGRTSFIISELIPLDWLFGPNTLTGMLDRPRSSASSLRVLGSPRSPSTPYCPFLTLSRS